MLDAVLRCERVVFSSYDWRLQQDFMRILSTLPRCFQLDAVNVRVVPAIFRRLHSAVLQTPLYLHRRRELTYGLQRQLPRKLTCTGQRWN